MIQHVFDFDDQMMMSEGECGKKTIESIILSVFPGAVKAERASCVDDRNGTDYWVTMPSGHLYSVDVKVRELDWCKLHPNEDDLALEIWSVVESGKVGWTRDMNKRTDYTMWIWKDTGRYTLIPFPMLREVFRENFIKWRKQYKTRQQTSVNKNGARWKSECTFVPRKLVWNAIYAKFGGIPS